MPKRAPSSSRPRPKLRRRLLRLFAERFADDAELGPEFARRSAARFLRDLEGEVALRRFHGLTYELHRAGDESDRRAPARSCDRPEAVASHHAGKISDWLLDTYPRTDAART